jgi:hypothetical protein
VKRTSFVLIIALFFFLSSCHATKKDFRKSTDSQGYRSVAIKKYGHNIKYILNPSNTYVICLKRNKPTPQMPENLISFFVYDLANEEIILEEPAINGEVAWKTNHEVQVRIIPGILTTDENYNKKLSGYTFDVNLGKKE